MIQTLQLKPQQRKIQQQRKGKIFFLLALPPLHSLVEMKNTLNVFGRNSIFFPNQTINFFNLKRMLDVRNPKSVGRVATWYFNLESILLKAFYACTDTSKVPTKPHKCTVIRRERCQCSNMKGESDKKGILCFLILHLVPIFLSLRSLYKNWMVP